MIHHCEPVLGVHDQRGLPAFGKFNCGFSGACSMWYSVNIGRERLFVAGLPLAVVL